MDKDTGLDVPPFQVLGNFRTADELVEALGYIPATREPFYRRSPGLEVRPPGRSRDIALNESPIAGWHQDGPLGSALVLWSDVYPTEVVVPLTATERARFTTVNYDRQPSVAPERILAGAPGDAVLINNNVARHRMPPAYGAALRQGRDIERNFVRLTLHSQADVETYVSRIRRAADRGAAA